MQGTFCWKSNRDVGIGTCGKDRSTAGEEGAIDEPVDTNTSELDFFKWYVKGWKVVHLGGGLVAI